MEITFNYGAIGFGKKWALKEVSTFRDISSTSNYNSVVSAALAWTVLLMCFANAIDIKASASTLVKWNVSNGVRRATKKQLQDWQKVKISCKFPFYSFRYLFYNFSLNVLALGITLSAHAHTSELYGAITWHPWDPTVLIFLQRHFICWILNAYLRKKYGFGTILRTRSQKKCG